MSAEKDTLIIGGAQGIQMVSTFLRAKIISVILGPVGFGIYSILISAIMLFQQVGSLGLNQAAIKELSEAARDNENHENLMVLKSHFLKVSSRLAIFGGIVMAVCSGILSLFFFDDFNHSFYFVAVSIGLVFYSLSQSYNSVLQSLRQLLTYAKVSIYTSVGTLVSAAVLVYLFDIWGLIFSIICGYAINCYLGSQAIKSKYHRIKSTAKEAILNLRPALQRGFFIMLGTVFITLFTLLLNGIIGRSSIENVGLFQASASIISQGLVIMSMILATEFYPRICAISDKEQLRKGFNEELRLLLVILMPVQLGVIWMAPLIVTILYSDAFILVPQLIRIMCLSLPFRLLWMISGFIILSRGEKYAYFIFDGLIGNGINFMFCVAGFHLFGLIGLAWGWAIGALCTSILLLTVISFRYSIHISFLDAVFVIALSIVGCFLYLMLSDTGFFPYSHIIAGTLFILATIYCLYRLKIFTAFKSKFLR